MDIKNLMLRTNANVRMALLRKNVGTVKIEKTIGMFHKFQLEKCSPAST